uniref:Uncharacterized protein n=1 Tax=Cucumis sativus TaxID=3659 RepID=A0A0A0KFQ4_CUCSA
MKSDNHRCRRPVQRPDGHRILNQNRLPFQIPKGIPSDYITRATNRPRSTPTSSRNTLNRAAGNRTAGRRSTTSHPERLAAKINGEMDGLNRRAMENSGYILIGEGIFSEGDDEREGLAMEEG